MANIADDNMNEIIRKSVRKTESNKYTIATEFQDPKSAFGEILVAQRNPEIQIDAVYGLRTKTDVEIYKNGTGSQATVYVNNGHEFIASCGTDVGGYGVIRSKRALRYRPGQGAEALFTARFGSPIPNHQMGAGLITSGNEISFRYQNTTFGVFHRTGGRLEIQKLTINTPASGAETLTITLNNTTFNVNVTSGIASKNAYEISTGTYSGYQAFSNGSTVIFHAQSVGNQTGTFSVSSTGTLAGTFTEVKSGASNIDNFIPQSDWNIDKMDGTGPSGMILDPTKGNVYRIDFQYLGFGGINFYIEDDNLGTFQKVHQIKYSNRYTTTNLLNPTFKVGWFSYSFGSTTDVAIYGGSAACFNQGFIKPFRNPDSHAYNKTGITTTLTNIISFRNRAVFSNSINLTEVIPLFVSFSVSATKPVQFTIYKNAQLGGISVWTYHDEDGGCTEYDISATTVTNVVGTTEEFGNFEVAKDGDIVWDLSKYNIKLLRGEYITLAAQATSGTADVLASMTFLED
jgi:hypothetical protein